MTHTLTQQEIAELFIFCEKHHVHYYDVQLELVDHLANAIEEKMSVDPGLTFELALLAVHTGFGVTGFAGIVKARQKSMEKYCEKKRWELFKSYFTWPKAVIAICLLAALALVKDLVTVDEWDSFFTIAGFSLLVAQLAVISWSVYLFKTQPKKLLITETGRTTGFIVIFFLFNFFVIEINHRSNFDYYFSGVVSILFLIYILAYRDFMIKLNQLIRKEYPQVFEVIA